MTKPLTAADLYQMIEARYPAPGHATFPQVGNGTGARTYRHADAVVCSLFPSAGLWVDGFEIKVARGDWLHELKHPEKADAVAQYCTRWWVVAPSTQIVDPGEMPPHWGLMTVHGDGLRVKKQAKQHDTPATVDRTFFAALMRAAYKYAWNEDRIRAQLTQRAEQIQEQRKHALVRAQRDLQELQDKVAKFHEVTGIDLEHAYDIEKIGAVVNAIQSAHMWRLPRMRQLHEEMKEMLVGVEKVITRADEYERTLGEMRKEK